MIKIKNRTKHFIGCLIAIFMLLMLGGIFAGARGISFANAVEGNDASIELFDESISYHIGDSVRFPNTIEVDGEIKNVYTHVRFPDGITYKKNEVVLSVPGEYSVNYYTEGKELLKATKFYVVYDLLEFGSNKSSVQYANIADVTGVNVEKNATIVNLFAQDTALYTKPIDVSDNTNNSLLNMVLLKNREGIQYAGNLVITLMDTFDASRNIEIHVRPSPYSGYSYAKVKVGNGLYKGLESHWNGSFIYNGNSYVLHENNEYGAYVPFGFFLDNLECNFNLVFNNQDKTLWLNNALLIDLDDPMIYAEPWEGFTNDLCQIAIQSKSVTADWWFALTSVDNEKVSGLYWKDATAPKIDVDLSEMVGALPIVGKEFTLPNATAFDAVDGACKVERAVWVNYQNITETLIYAENGKFIPSTAREYTLVYTASDSSGNIAVEKFVLNSYTANEYPSMAVSLGSDKTESGTVGTFINLADYQIENNNGSVSVEKWIEFEDETYQLDAEETKFYPIYAGDYTVTYVVKDYVDTVTLSYVISVSVDNANASFKDNAVVPKYIIKNATYETPVLYGYTFNNGSMSNEKAEVYIAPEKTIDNSYKITKETFTCTWDGVCYIGFKLAETIQWHEIKIVDVGFNTKSLNISNYFQGTDGTEVVATANKTYTEYQVGNPNGNASIEFINAIQVFDFAFEFVVPEERTYNEFELILEDLTRTASLKLHFTLDQDGNGECRVGDKAYSIRGLVGRNVIVAYAAKDSIITITAGATVHISVDTSALYKNWTSFYQNKANLKVVLNTQQNVAGVLNVYKVNNQLINNKNSDVIMPQYSTAEMLGRFNLGTQVNMTAIQVADVLSPYVTVDFTIFNDNNDYFTIGNIVFNGTASWTEEYQFTLEEYGSLYVTYVIKDAQNNRKTYSYVLSVKDLESPVVYMKNGYLKEAKVGQEVKVAEVVVQDNVSSYEECELFTYVLTPDNKIEKVKNDTFVATRTGNYTVYYQVKDKAGNVAMYNYIVTVK